MAREASDERREYWLAVGRADAEGCSLWRRLRRSLRWRLAVAEALAVALLLCPSTYAVLVDDVNDRADFARVRAAVDQAHAADLNRQVTFHHLNTGSGEVDTVSNGVRACSKRMRFLILFC